MYILFLNSNWNEDQFISEHQTSDASIGYPPELTRERFISLVKNTINHGVLKKILSTRRRDNIIHDSQLFYFTRCRNTVNFIKILFTIPANTIHQPEILYVDYV
jgi:hypothetical protein